jgi:hypothetical protein
VPFGIVPYRGPDLGHDARGTPYWYYERVMPIVDPALADAVFFLYESEQDAWDHAESGATGFLVGSRGPRKGMVFLTAVTAAHVIEGGATVIRVNTKAGGVEVLPYDGDQWTKHPHGDDVAACPVGMMPDGVKYSYVLDSDFVVEGDQDFMKTARRFRHARRREERGRRDDHQTR